MQHSPSTEKKPPPSLAPVLRTVRRRLKQLYGDRLVEVVLFGSYARGTAGPGSDVDVLVVLRGPVDPVAEARRVGPLLLAVSLDQGVALSLLHLEEGRFRDPRHPLMMNVNEEGIRL